MNDSTYSTDHGCVLCPNPERRRLPYRPPVCEACRSWLAGLIADIRIRYEELTTDHGDLPDVRTVDVHNRKGELVPLRDPVIATAPAGRVPGAPSGPRTAQIAESRPPLPLEPLDLTMPAREGSRAAYARAVAGVVLPLVGEVPVGTLSVATILDSWVRDFITTRTNGEHLPDATVDQLSRWLGDRTEWACDHHPAVDEFAAELREVRAALLAVLGYRDWPTQKDGPCPRCDSVDLWVRNGSEWVECGTCGTLLSPAEYTQWVRSVAAQHHQAA